MKKLLIILLSIPVFSQAQLHSGFGIGTDFKHAVATLNVGYQVKQVVIEGEIAPSLTRDTATHNYMGLKIGYDFGVVIPSIGYYYDRVSADKPPLNGSYLGYSIKAYAMLTERGGIFLNALFLHKVFQFTGGIHYEF